VTLGRDDDFRRLFEQEAATRLPKLTEQLLELERGGPTPELIASLFREAHTLKGAAAVVGLDDASRVAHALEDLLDDVRGGRRAVTPELVDVAFAAVDGLTEMIPGLIAGNDCRAAADSLEQAVRTVRRDSDASDVSEKAATNAQVGAVPAPAQARPAQAAPVPAGTTGVPSASHPAGRGTEPRDDAPRRRRTDSETIAVPVNRLDELVRLVGESAAAHLRVGRMLSERLDVDPGTLAEFHDLSRVLNELQERTMRARMVPVSTVTDRLHRAVRDLSRSLGKQGVLEVRGGDTELDRSMLQQLADPLMHLVRNALDHGVESPEERAVLGKPKEATIRLHAMQLGSEVIITITDDGRGIDVARVREAAARQDPVATELSDQDALLLIFRSGLSTATFVSDVSGRGVGLDVVHNSVEAARGRIEVRSEPGSGTEFRIVVPITLAVLRCLIVTAGGARYALPMHSVVVAQRSGETVETHADGRPLVWVGDTAIPVSGLAGTLGGDPSEQHGPVVVIAGMTRRHAFRVDALAGQRDVVVKELGHHLPRLEVLAGASVEPDGSILLVLDALGLIERARLGRTGGERITQLLDEQLLRPRRRASVLVVDDALAVREVQRTILERAGFAVRLAADGVEALARLAEEPSDLVLTDVEMPRMDGFTLTESIRAHERFANIPVLILTSRASEADRRRGLDVGADGYIVKSAFDEAGLLAAVDRLLGGRS
jgi:two-component system chemotaxis sensor kinase CheA